MSNNSGPTLSTKAGGGGSLLGPAPALVPSSNAPSSTTGRGAPIADFEFQGGETGARGQAAKSTARLNASKVPNSEIKSLYEERQRLVAKQLDETITKTELIRLEYVRWSLDRVEDAQHGASLDELERGIEQFGKLADQLRNLHDGLQNAAATKKRR
jgi:hypothetical protein